MMKKLIHEEFKGMNYLTNASDTLVVLYPKNEREVIIRTLKRKNSSEDIFDVIDIFEKEEGI